MWMYVYAEVHVNTHTNSKNVNCISETHIQDPTFIITLSCPNTTSLSRFTLRRSGDLAPSACGHTSIRIALIRRAERTLSHCRSQWDSSNRNFLPL